MEIIKREDGYVVIVGKIRSIILTPEEWDELRKACSEVAKPYSKKGEGKNATTDHRGQSSNG